MTASYAALLGLVFLGLSIWVVKGRALYRVAMGDGGQPALFLRIRSHANFAEYVPLGLILIGFNEMVGMNGWGLHALAAILLLSRIAHPVGMVLPATSRWQRPFRGFGVLGSWGVILISSLLLLVGLV
ncbi:MAPEG family protein [Aquamicrobium segne]|uniref:MAPEG family protein n=1 Tax=Aquamicrobium segne TaxID=469547 RepID=A0ABW0GZL5_9HYPH